MPVKEEDMKVYEKLREDHMKHWRACRPGIIFPGSRRHRLDPRSDIRLVARLKLHNTAWFWLRRVFAR
jgi:hypothetical protein